MMNIYLTFILMILSFALSGYATRLSNVYVDLLKGYAQHLEENGDTSRYYMGRVTYHLFAEDDDSILIDFGIARNNTDEMMNIFEKSGDVGYVKQKHVGDTVKTAYFNVKMTGSIAGEFIGIVFAYAGKSKLRQMADSLVGLMTAEQKQSLLYCSSTNTLYANFGQENMKLPDGTSIIGWRCADGPHGIRYPLGPANEYAIYGAGDTVTLFPTEAALGCSWDINLTYKIGQAIAKESRAMGVYCNLGPMCDLVINPRWGRAFETMGEDPYHVGHMAASQARGLQSEKVIATPKHFGPYIAENDRGLIYVYVEQRAQRELFCVPFQTCIEEADVHALMTCYHHVRSPGYTTDIVTDLNNGADFAGSNRYNIETILRHDWGFDGIIMTDWDGARFVDSKYAYETDFDMSMPIGLGGYEQIAANVTNNIWPGEPLDRKAKRVMYGKLWAWNGQLPTTDDQLKTYPKSIILCQEHLDLSLEAARKSITLVKNEIVDGAPVLPLDKNGTLNIAVVGPYANVKRPGGGGSSAVTPDKIITPLEGIKALVANNPNINVSSNYEGADVAIVCVGTIGESESTDRTTMALPNEPLDQNNLVLTVMNKVKKTIVLYTGGSASYAGKWSDAPAIIVAFYPGRFQGQAMAEVLFGDVNPGGHLAVTFPRLLSDLPNYDAQQYILSCPSVDTAHGYFLYEKKGLSPLFWFGHGLSYTAFTYDEIKIIGGTSISAGDRINIQVTLTNSGEIAGDDVVQLYIKPKTITTIPRRVKDLRGFERVTLAAHETKTINFVLGPRDFSVYIPDPATRSGKWTITPGEYEIQVGSTSDPAVLTGNNGQSLVATVSVN